MKHLLKYLLFFIALSSGKISYAQDWNLILEMVVTDESKNMSGAEVNVYRDGQFVEKLVSNAKGRVDVKLKPDGVYTVAIGGSNDYIKKKIEINTNGVPAETFSADVYFPAEVDIFKKLEGLNYNILNQPIGKIAFQKEVGGFEVDRGYTQQMQAELANLEKDYLAQKKKEAAAEKQKQKEYDAAIKKADGAFKNEDWETAEQEYKKAAELKPLETYPSFQLAELQGKLIEIRKRNTHYEASIKKADDDLAAKDYKSAITEYKLASSYKPNEEYPKTKVSEIQGILTAQAKTDQAYLAAIEKGDNALKVSELESAKSAFEEAAKLKPEENYPKNKLLEINAVLQKKQIKEANYQAAVKEGDDALAATKYADAKTAYEKAQGIKPTETYPAEQIKKVEGLMAVAAKKDQDYLAAVEKGDNALKAKSYEEAITAFETASSIKSAEEYPKNKIKEIKDFMAKSAANEKAYQDNITTADKAFGKAEYESAKAAYQAALKLKPKESYPQEKITEIEATLAANAKKTENYKAAIAQGDEALKSKDYSSAKTAYNNALAIKADEQYPKDKISEIETIQKQLESTQADYDKAIAKGDEALATKDYEGAKKSYQEAIQLKEDEQYPKDKLAQIEETIAQLAEKEDAYSKAIEEGDKARGTGDLTEAKTKYTAALTIKPEASYPKQQIDEINKKLAEREKIEADYQLAIAKADKALEAKDYQQATKSYQAAIAIKDDDYPREKIRKIEELLAASKAKDANYQAAIDKGDDAFAKKNWESAKMAYQEALTIKKEDYPATQIAAIESEIKKETQAKEALAKVEADYQKAISEGDAKLSSDNLEGALAAYQEASDLKPDENYPKGKITDIQAEIKKRADKKAADEALAAKEKQYQDLIVKADKEMKAQDLEQARKDYQAALVIKSDEKYPQSKIDEINSTLADAEKQEESYQNAIKDGDNLLAKEDWKGAKEQYSTAASIKPNEQYPKDKLQEIEDKLATIAANEEQIRIEKEKSAAKEKEYQELITAADEFYKDKKYDDAKTKYQAALKVKNEEYPQKQIDKIGEELLAIKESKAEAAAAKEEAKKEAQYQALIAEADAFLEDNNLKDAKEKYIDAIGLKEDSYPANKIAEIDRQLDQLAAANAAKDKKAKLDKQYQEAIKNADAFLVDKNYDRAIKSYQAALSLKKEEEYPTEKIEEIKAILAKNDAKTAKKEADYQVAIASGDNAMSEKDYTSAKSYYNEALTLKANEVYPSNKLKEIDDLLAKQKQNAEELRIQQEQEAKNEASYQQAIVKADQLLKEKKLKEARNEYQLALGLKSSETYPQEQTDKIDKLLNDKATALAAAAEDKKAKAAALETNYNELIESGDNAFSSKQYHLAQREYKSAIALKPDETYPKQQIEKIEELLASKEKEEKEKEQIADEPIKIQTGKRASIDSDAEDKIDQMYEEIWAKNKAEKSKKIQEKEETIKELSDKRREEEFNNRKNAIERIEDISVSLQKQNKEATAYNLQNYETVKEKTKALKKYHIEKERNDEHKRNEAYAQKEDYAKSIKEYNEKINNDRKGVKEAVEKEYQDYSETLSAYAGEQRKRMGIGKTKVEQKAENIRAYNQERSEKQQNSGKETLKEKTAGLKEIREEYQQEQHERIGTSQTKAEQKAEHIREYNQERSAKQQSDGKETLKEKTAGLKETADELHEEQKERIGIGQTKVERKAENIRAYNQQRASKQLDKNQQDFKNKSEGIKETEDRFQSNSKDRRQDNQKDIDAMTLGQKQYAEAKSESFKEGQNEVEQKAKALKEENARLEKNAKENREENVDKKYYRGEDLPRQDKAAAEYPQGVTEKIIEGNNSTTIQRIVVNGTQVDIYEKTLYNYGKTFYTKNGINITEEVWDTESK